MRSYRKLTRSTLVAVYVLILVGGIVRSTGSGMGCPDWPKCFGNWVPPTSISELPPDYKTIYSDYRHKKNVRFARYLRLIGLGTTAERILEDESVRIEADFNPQKTMVEYFNRLVGVTIGMLIFAVLVSSLRFRKSHPWITIISAATFLLVVFQGWIGSIVVSTNLTPWTITLHMFLALLIVALLVYLDHVSTTDRPIVPYSPVVRLWLVACMVVLLVQVLLGTQVREAVDRVAPIAARDQWISAIGSDFILHRSFSWAVLILHAGLIITLVRTTGWGFFPVAFSVIVLATVCSGIGMAWFGVPPFLQPLHLLLATLAFGVQFMLLLRVNSAQKTLAYST